MFPANSFVLPISIFHDQNCEAFLRQTSSYYAHEILRYKRQPNRIKPNYMEIYFLWTTLDCGNILNATYFCRSILRTFIWPRLHSSVYASISCDEVELRVFRFGKRILLYLETVGQKRKGSSKGGRRRQYIFGISVRMIIVIFEKLPLNIPCAF